MLGREITKILRNREYEVLSVGSDMVDLTSAQKVGTFFEKYNIGSDDEIYNCAGYVGGIGANRARHFEFLSRNLTIALNVTHFANFYNVRRLNYISSSCMYPRNCDQPMTIDHLGTGKFEPTNEGYAIAKFVGTKLCEYLPNRDYVSFVPCNLYGNGDNFSETGHVLASIVRKVVDAKAHGDDKVILWGDGSPRREFLHARDAAHAIVSLADMRTEKPFVDKIINIGSGEDHSIIEVAELVAKVANWPGQFVFDVSKSNGMPRKLMDIEVLRQTGWRQLTSLHDGIDELIYEYQTSCCIWME